MLTGVKSKPPSPRPLDKVILLATAVAFGWASIEVLSRLYGVEGRPSIIEPLLRLLP